MAVYVKGKDGNRVKVAGLGPQGPAGKSAYQYAAQGGFSGSEDQFAALLGGRSNRNLLDNWYWLDPVNQKGKAEYTGDGYTIDRWKHEASSSAVSITPGGLVFSGPVAPNARYFSEFIDIPPEWFAGKTLTGSIMVDGQLFCGTVTIKEQYDDWEGEPFAENDNFKFRFQKSPVNEFYNGYFRAILTYTQETVESRTAFQAVKLELGPNQTLAHKEGDAWVLNDPPPDKAAELAKCQRYMLVLPGTGSIWANVGVGISNDNSVLAMSVPTPVSMRAVPTIAAYGNWVLRGAGKVATFAASERGWCIMYYSKNMADIIISGFSGLSIQQPYFLQKGNDSASKIILDANL